MIVSRTGLLYRTTLALAVLVMLLPVLVLPTEHSDAATDEPYLAGSVPVAGGCIVLGRQWSGVKVFLVQRRLGTTYEKDRYGPDTYQAVRTFQRHHHLPVTGRVNRPTWRAMGFTRPFCLDRFTVQPRVGLGSSARERSKAMLAWVRTQLGQRYVWGGAGPLGYDCSGLALQGMYAGGRVVPSITTRLHQRQDFGTASAIYQSGLRRVPLADRKRGDLVFYGPTGSMTHMAIYLGHDRVVEAVRPRVRISSMWAHEVPLKPRVVRPFGR